MVNLQPLLHAPPAVIVHLATVLPAFALGTWLIFFSAKGARYHRLAGTAYLGLMTVTAVAALFIRAFGWSVTIGPFTLGLLHLFVLLTFHGVWTTIRALRAGNIAGHRASMKGMYLGGLIVAGMLAFAPGRIMHRVFFG